MKEDIIEILKGDEEIYNLIMQKNRQSDVVKIRWNVWIELKKKGYSNGSISRYFGFNQSAIGHAIKELTPYTNKNTFKDIPESLIAKTKKHTNGDNKALFFALNNIGYSQAVIAKAFNLTRAKVSKDVRKYITDKEFEERRKKIVKFRKGNE